MGFLDSIEKLINEHGSAAILRERIALLNEQHAAVEKKAVLLEQQVARLLRENERLELDNQQLQVQIDNSKTQLVHNSNPHGYVCDHCGSPQLKRTGNKPDPTFGCLGVKQPVFTCAACGQESAFTQEP